MLALGACHLAVYLVWHWMASLKVYTFFRESLIPDPGGRDDRMPVKGEGRQVEDSRSYMEMIKLLKASIMSLRTHD